MRTIDKQNSYSKEELKLDIMTLARRTENLLYIDAEHFHELLRIVAWLIDKLPEDKS